MRINVSSSDQLKELVSSLQKTLTPFSILDDGYLFDLVVCGKEDILLNTIKSIPTSEIVIFDGITQMSEDENTNHVLLDILNILKDHTVYIIANSTQELY
jgi:hypothetical protein